MLLGSTLQKTHHLQWLIFVRVSFHTQPEATPGSTFKSRSMLSSNCEEKAGSVALPSFICHK